MGKIEEIRYFDKKELRELLKHPEQMTSSAVEIIEEYILKKI